MVERTSKKATKKPRTKKAAKLSAMSVMCDCLDLINAKLAEVHTELSVTLILLGGMCLSFPTILSEKKYGAPHGALPRKVIPTYCPFCGVRYPDVTAVSAKQIAEVQ